MSQIVIGKSGTHNVSIDRKLLMSTRLLITSDSGGGKTWLLKRLIEQAFGDVGIIVIDPEGEFAPLRTKFDFFLVGKGGDTPADIRSAGKVAHALLAGRASAICDIYEMAASERHIFVQRFLDALLDAPKELRHPYFVIVDEAHMFCPEHGKGESVAADAMRGLATRGRKRMLCGIYATQRLATLSKDLTGMCLNRLVGPTFETINQKRGADELGIPKPEQAEFFRSIKMLEPGNFYALGRAITKDLELVHVGPIETPHGHEALKYELKPPPPTERVRAWLKELGDLPAQAEAEAKTTAEFKKKIKDLEKRVREIGVTEIVRPVVDQKAIDRAVSACRKETMEALTRARTRMVSLARAPVSEFAAYYDTMVANVDLEIEAIKQVSGEESKKGASVPKTESKTAVPQAGTVRPSSQPRPISFSQQARVDHQSNNGVPGPQRKILRALSELESVGKTRPSNEMVAAWAGYSPNGGAFNNPLGWLRSAGYVTREGNGTIGLTVEGAALAGVLPAPDQEEINRRIMAILDGPKRKILQVLIDAGKNAMLEKADIAAGAGYEANGGAFNNPMGALRTAGFIEYPQPGWAKAADWIFVE